MFNGGKITKLNIQSSVKLQGTIWRCKLQVCHQKELFQAVAELISDWTALGPPEIAQVVFGRVQEQPAPSVAVPRAAWSEKARAGPRPTLLLESSPLLHVSF